MTEKSLRVVIQVAWEGSMDTEGWQLQGSGQIPGAGWSTQPFFPGPEPAHASRGPFSTAPWHFPTIGWWKRQQLLPHL